jgi:uncharacterized membrane protein
MDAQKLLALLLVGVLMFFAWVLAITLPSSVGESTGYASVASGRLHFSLTYLFLFFAIAVVLVLLYCVFKRFKQNKQGK